MPTSVMPRATAAVIMTLCAGGCASTSGGSPTSPPTSGNRGTPGASIPTPAGSSEPALPSAGTDSSSGSATPGSATQGGAASEAASSSGNGASGSARAGHAQTPEERRAAIDKHLDESLGTLDAQIKKEQERNAQERDARNAAAVGSGSSGSDSDAQPKKTADSDSGTAETEAPANDTNRKGSGDKARPGDLKSDKRKPIEPSGSGSAGGRSGVQAYQIPDSSGDDIVAKRLRRAAEQETDPELKDKLWREYIEYKKNAGK